MGEAIAEMETLEQSIKPNIKCVYSIFILFYFRTIFPSTHLLPTHVAAIYSFLIYSLRTVDVSFLFFFILLIAGASVSMIRHRTKFFFFAAAHGECENEM